MTRSISDARIRREAADWFARLNARTVSVSDLEAFRRWRSDPARRDAYAALEDLWRRSGELAEDGDIGTALAQAVVRPNRAWRPGMPALAAAALAAVAMGGLLWSQTWPRTYDTETGERRLIRLADGSRIHLDTASEVSVRLLGDRRELKLISGQALFTVAHDVDRPFTVKAGEIDVIALGTRFDVRRTTDGVRVTLLEGRVAVRRPGSPSAEWRLGPGEQIIAGSSSTTDPIRVDVRSATAWTLGRLEFDDVPLSHAVTEINRYETRPLLLAQGVDPTLPVSGVFDAGEGPAFAEAAAHLHGLTVLTDETRILLGPGTD